MIISIIILLAIPIAMTTVLLVAIEYNTYKIIKNDKIHYSTYYNHSELSNNDSSSDSSNFYLQYTNNMQSLNL